MSTGPNDAAWFYLSRADFDAKGSTIGTVSIKHLPKYERSAVMLADEVNDCCAWVAGTQGAGWVYKTLLDLTPEERRAASVAKREREASLGHAKQLKEKKPMSIRFRNCSTAAARTF